MGRPHYEMIICQSALNRVEGMPFRWSLNPYRGCPHSCVYCYARRTHAFYDLDVGKDFEEILFVKKNLPWLLRDELRRPGWRGESIAIGTATDPYQPAEGTFRITRQCLEVLAERSNPCSITTKGTLALRDIDVMQQLTDESTFEVHLSIVTLDRQIWQRVEPGTPPPSSRLRALERLRTAGIPVSVFLAPILPGVTDRPDQLSAVVRAAAEHGATAVHSNVLRLAPGVKEWFMTFLGREFPHLVPSYERGYALGANAPSVYRKRVAERVETIRSEVVFQPLAAAPAEGRVGRQFTLPW